MDPASDLFDFMVNRVEPSGEGTAIFVPCMSSTLTTSSISRFQCS
jgi:hypothetical protein